MALRMSTFTNSLVARFFIAFLLLSSTLYTGAFAQVIGNCTANAGSARSVCSSSVTLTGSVGGTPGAANPTWTFVSGPVTPVIATPNQLTTNVTGMTETGDYRFRLSQPCGQGVPATSVVTITVKDCKPPLAQLVAYTLPTQPVQGQTLTFDGSPGNPPAPNGFDAEDGPLGGSTTTSTLIIRTLPANGILSYNGLPVSAGDIIPGFDATKLTIQLTGSGYQSVSFQYNFRDSDGLQGNIAPVTVSWSQALPVTLVSFKAEKTGSSVILTWSTSEEKNNTGFELLRSADAAAWERIGFVKSQADKSYVNTLLNYSFQDTNPLDNTSYYRLKQIDYDGRYQLGPVRSVSAEGSRESVLIYPNPTNDKLTVEGLSGKEIIRLSSESGREVSVIRNESDKQKIIPTQALKPGVYILTLTRTDGSALTKRIVKVR